MLKSFHRNIIAQIVLLLCLFMFSIVALHIDQGLMQKRQSYLQMLLEKEQVKIEFSHILQKKILAINVKLRDMSMATSIAELKREMTFLSVLHAELIKILVVLDQGGSQQINNLINFGFKKAIPRTLEYEKFGKPTINIEILKLKAKLPELLNFIQEFQPLVEQKIQVSENRDLIQVSGVIHKVDNYYKGIEPFFKRMLENLHDLNSQSLEEVERIRRITTQFSQNYQQIENTSTVVILVFIMLMGGLILKSSRKILLERHNFEQQLLFANENLETIVQKRTLVLKKQVADRKAGEIKIKNQTDFLRQVLESLPLPLYVIDAQDYSLILANSAALKQGDGTQTTCYALTHKRDLPCDNVEIPCPLQIMKKTGEVVILERTHRDKQGKETFSEIHGYPIFDDNGTLVQMIEYSLDITAKKIAEKSLKQTNEQLEEKIRERTGALEEQILQREEAQWKLIKSERYFRRLIENVSDVITILDEDGIIAYASPSVEKVMGVAPEKIIGFHIKNMVLNEDLTHVDIPTLYALYSGATPMEYRLKDRTGAVHVMESYIQKFQQDDDSDGYILYSRDITVRKKAEEENHKLQMVVEQSPSSVVITDIEGTIEYVNPAFEKITGYSSAEAIGLNPKILNSGKTPESAFTQLWETITTGHIWRGEFINKKKNGELYNENVLVIPIKNINGEITNFVAVKENVTELKRARKQAERANQAKSNFLSQMSHELRTPLNAINGFSQLMLKSKKNPLNEKQRDMTGQIHTAGQHLLQLINEILDLSRIESGEFSLSLEPLDPHIVLDACLFLTKPLADEKSITITNQCDGKEFPSIRADLTRAKQIVLNFLSNAVKYNNSGGSVVINIETNIPGFLRFIFADNGIGIPEDKQKDIFTPFTRAVENSEDIEGTGIGMTITKQLVEKMGGDIGFESQLGEGSTFWFTLPVAVANILPELTLNSSENKNEIIPSADSVLKKLVLYVEDNPVNITFMQEFFLELEDFQLITASTGEEGVSMALKNIPDLILMDLNLPGIDGFQAYRQLKENPRTEFVPVVVVSADAMEKTVKRVHKMGFDGYVPKPVDVDLLLEIMTDIFEG